MSFVILLAIIAVLMVWGWWMDEKYDENERVINRMARRDMRSERKRGDIDKEGKCYYGGYKIF